MDDQRALGQLDALIAKGDAVSKRPDGEQWYDSGDRLVARDFAEWRSQSLAFAQSVLRDGHPYLLQLERVTEPVETNGSPDPQTDNREAGIGVLRAIREDVANGYLTDFRRASQFKDQMPEGVKAIIAAARQESLGDQTVTTEVMKRIAEMLRRLRPQRYRRHAGGSVRASGSVPGAGNGRATGGGSDNSGPTGPPNGPGADVLLGLLDDEGEEAEEASNPPLSLHAEWKSEAWINSQAVVGGHDVTDRAGALIGPDASSAGLLALNEDFRGFTRFVDEIDREMNPDGDDDLRSIIEAKCREYTLQKMLEAVLGVRQLENGNQWMANEIKDALGPTALTTAFMADRYHTWQSVKRVVGSKARNIQAAAAS